MWRSKRSRPLSGEIRTFPGISPKNTRAPGPHFVSLLRFTADGPRRPYPHGRHLAKLALDYHAYPTRQNLRHPTKTLANQDDLSLAYSPAWPPRVWPSSTRRRRRVQVHLARQPGGRDHQRHRRAGSGQHRPAGRQARDGRQGRLFKKFAGIDVFDIELAENDPTSWSTSSRRWNPRWAASTRGHQGARVLHIEKKLRERMKIPVFHDDQHGTAIISSAAILNGLKVEQGHRLGQAGLLAGAAAIASPGPAVHLGVKREHIYVGLARRDRDGRDENMEANKKRYAQKTDARTLADVVNGADVFLGCSTAGVLTADMVGHHGRPSADPGPANPEPEIRPVARPRVPTASSPPAVPDYRTRSTTCCASLHLPRRHGRRRLAHHGRNEAGLRRPSPTWPRPSRTTKRPAPTPARNCRSAPTTSSPSPDPRLIVQIAPAVAPGRRRVRRGRPSHRGHRGLPPEADGLRVPLAS